MNQVNHFAMDYSSTHLAARKGDNMLIKRFKRWCFVQECVLFKNVWSKQTFRYFLVMSSTKQRIEMHIMFHTNIYFCLLSWYNCLLSSHHFLPSPHPVYCFLSCSLCFLPITTATASSFSFPLSPCSLALFTAISYHHTHIHKMMAKISEGLSFQNFK